MIVTRLSVARSMWLYSLISPAYPVVFCLGLFSGWRLACSMFLPLPLSVSAIKGKERVQTLGIRGSAEVVGTAVLTFGVSLLIRFGWQAAFLVYGISIPILLLYLLFVPYGSKTEAVEENTRM